MACEQGPFAPTARNSCIGTKPQCVLHEAVSAVRNSNKFHCPEITVSAWVPPLISLVRNTCFAQKYSEKAEPRMSANSLCVTPPLTVGQSEHFLAGGTEGCVKHQIKCLEGTAVVAALLLLVKQKLRTAAAHSFARRWYDTQRA